MALAAFGRRRKRSLKEGRTWVSDLDVAKVRLENNIEMFIKKLSFMDLNGYHKVEKLTNGDNFYIA